MNEEEKKEKGKRKFTCPVCKVFRWLEDFGCESYKNLVANPTPCDFCKIREEHLQEITGLKDQIKALQELIVNLKSSSSSESNCTSRKTEEDVEVIRVTKEKRKKKKARRKSKKHDRAGTPAATSESENSQSSAANGAGVTIAGDLENFTTVTGRKAAKSGPKSVQQVAISTSNRYALLCPEEEHAILVGDSQVRGQERHFGAVAGTKREVRCLPGRNGKGIRKEVEKLRVKDRATAIVAQVTGNDLFRKKGNTGNTEDIISSAMKMVDDLKLKTDRAVLIGVLPRLGSSSHALSKVIGINERLQDLCIPEGVQFVDPYNLFYGRQDLYQPDGVHLNNTGQAVMGNLVNQVLYRVIRSTRVKSKSQIIKGKNHTIEKKSIEVTPQREITLEVTSQSEIEPETEGTHMPAVELAPEGENTLAVSSQTKTVERIVDIPQVAVNTTAPVANTSQNIPKTSGNLSG